MNGANTDAVNINASLNLIGFKKMGAILSRTVSEDDFEKELAQLDVSIREGKVSLNEIKCRSRQVQFYLLTFGIAGYLILFLLCIFDLKFGYHWPRIVNYPLLQLCFYFTRHATLTPPDLKILNTITWIMNLFLCPIMFYLVRGTARIFYGRIIDTMESNLKVMQSRQKLKLEELKKKTKFYLMKDLVERYERGIDSLGGKPAPKKIADKLGLNNANLPPQNARPVGALPPNTPVSPIVSQENAVKGQPQAQSDMQAVRKAPIDAPSKQAPRKSTPPPPVGRTWVDRMIDSLIGEDVTLQQQHQANSSQSSLSSINGNSTIFALICKHCGNHNGLVSEKDYVTLRYQCPRCASWNIPSAISSEKAEEEPISKDDQDLKNAWMAAFDESSIMEKDKATLSDDDHEDPHIDGEEDTVDELLSFVTQSGINLDEEPSTPPETVPTVPSTPVETGTPKSQRASKSSKKKKKHK